MKDQEITPSARIIRSIYDYIVLKPKRSVAAVLVAVVAISFVSSIHRIELDESGVLRRFGKVVASNIPPGLHWHLPFGIDVINEFKTAVVHRLKVNASIHPDMSTFTGDVNLVDAVFVVQFKVKELDKFFFGSNHPTKIVSLAVRSYFVDIISSMFVNMVLVGEKKHIEETILQKTQSESDKLGLGLEIVSVNMVYVSPPEDAIPAFRAVNDARAERVEVVEKAARRRDQSLAYAKGVAADMVDRAGAKAIAYTAQAQSDADKFNAILSEKRQEPLHVKHTYYWNKIKNVLWNSRVLALKSAKNTNISVNLMEGAKKPPIFAKSKNRRTKFAGIKEGGVAHGTHPWADSAHVTEGLVKDRSLDGRGGHREGVEAHHYNPDTYSGRRDPPHIIDFAGDAPRRGATFGSYQKKGKAVTKSSAPIRSAGAHSGMDLPDSHGGKEEYSHSTSRAYSFRRHTSLEEDGMLREARNRKVKDGGIDDDHSSAGSTYLGGVKEVHGQ